MTRTIAVSLCSMYPPAPLAPHLIFPCLREDQGNSVRVSEQESKILAAEWLKQHDWVYSVETPTRDQYGEGSSGNMDMTVYSKLDRLERTLNIELKAHQPRPRDCKNDIEKLLREDTDGLWFVTLEAAKPNWKRFHEKLETAFNELLEQESEPAIKGNAHSIHFAFCAVRPGHYRKFTIDFASDRPWWMQLGDGFDGDPEQL